MPPLTYFFLGWVGLGLWGVRRFHSDIHAFFNPTEFGKIANTISLNGFIPRLTGRFTLSQSVPEAFHEPFQENKPSHAAREDGFPKMDPTAAVSYLFIF